MPNAKRKKRTTKSSNDSWKDRSRRLEFGAKEQIEIKDWVESRTLDAFAILIDTADLGYYFKAKFSERYDNYTITIGCPPDHSYYPKHTFWFTYDDLEDGFKILFFVLQNWLETGHIQVDDNSNSGGWL